MSTLMDNVTPISFEKMLNPYKFYMDIFNANSKSLEDIKYTFRLIRPYLDPNRNWDSGVFENVGQSLKMILLTKYTIDEYPEYYV